MLNAKYRLEYSQ